jgi:multidrug efflux system outer membrane protein
VIDADRNLFNAQLSQSALQTAHLGAIVGLYKALGYGWPIDEPAAATAETATRHELEKVRVSQSSP